MKVKITHSLAIPDPQRSHIFIIGFNNYSEIGKTSQVFSMEL